VPSSREYFHFFGLDEEKLARAAPDALVMHPGPMNRGVEIDSSVADGPRSLIRNRSKWGSPCEWRCSRLSRNTSECVTASFGFGFLSKEVTNDEAIRLAGWCRRRSSYNSSISWAWELSWFPPPLDIFARPPGR